MSKILVKVLVPKMRGADFGSPDGKRVYRCSRADSLLYELVAGAPVAEPGCFAEDVEEWRTDPRVFDVGVIVVFSYDLFQRLSGVEFKLDSVYPVKFRDLCIFRCPLHPSCNAFFFFR